MYSSPLGATSEMRAARLTVRPKMSPSRPTIGPCVMPTWPGGRSECGEPVHQLERGLDGLHDVREMHQHAIAEKLDDTATVRRHRL